MYLSFLYSIIIYSCVCVRITLKNACILCYFHQMWRSGGRHVPPSSSCIEVSKRERKIQRENPFRVLFNLKFTFSTIHNLVYLFIPFEINVFCTLLLPAFLFELLLMTHFLVRRHHKIEVCV